MTQAHGLTDAGYFAHVSVAQLATELRARRLSPSQLVERALHEADRWQPRLNAFASVDMVGARAAAALAATELTNGLDRGPLHGIPVAVKDMIDVRDLPTEAGSRHLTGRVARHDAACVERLRAAGAIILGKTTTHEFANGPTGDRAANGPTRNPHATDRMAGGSSSGSAAAVAAGIVPLALGTDTGGSARIPASCCGIVGLRPTHGAISSRGVLPLAPSLDTVGLLARSAADCHLLWSALGPTPIRPLARARIGWVAPDPFFPTDAAIAAKARSLVDRLVTAVVHFPEADGLRSAYSAIQGREAYVVHAHRIDTARELFDPEVGARLIAGGEVTDSQYAQALATRDRASMTVASLFRDHDLLALPTLPLPPPVLGTRRACVHETLVDVRAALLSLTSPWSVLGLPAVSIPAGTIDGLPVGLQLVGRPGDESYLLAQAEQLPAQHVPAQ